MRAAPRTHLTAVLLLGAAILVASAYAIGRNPDALWRIVHDACVPGVKDGDEANQCEYLDPEKQYVIFKDMKGRLQYLLIPTDRITGIESPDILAPNAPNYWQKAWSARTFLEKRAGKTLPRDEIAMAINSVLARSQNQLHIHIDCVRTDVRRALAENEPNIGSAWSSITAPPRGHPYLAMKIEADELGTLNPFKLVAGIPSASADMGNQTIAVVGAHFSDGKDGFYLLTDHADLSKGDLASGEELLDHNCEILGDGLSQ
jgi:CDP-diacylglycerol pyrophosphatase